MENIQRLMVKIQSLDEAASFMDVLMTEKEREMILERMEIFFYLSEGLSQRKVAELTGAGIATVTRGAKAYKHNRESIDSFLEIYREYRI